MEHKHKRKNTKDKQLTIWEQITEYNCTMKKYYDQKEYDKITFGHVTIESPSGYLNRVIFPTLIPALEEILYAARRRGLLKKQFFTLFNGLDYLVEILWNNNKMHPERLNTWEKLYNMNWVQDYLNEIPRPLYPLSWLLTTEEAVIIIQSYYRGYSIRKEEDVQEMRIFWKAIKQEANEKKKMTDNGKL